MDRRRTHALVRLIKCIERSRGNRETNLLQRSLFIRDIFIFFPRAGRSITVGTDITYDIIVIYYTRDLRNGT